MFSNGEQKKEEAAKEEEQKVEEPEAAAENKTEEAVPKQDTPKEADGSGGFMAIVAALGVVGAGVAIFGSGESRPDTLSDKAGEA